MKNRTINSIYFLLLIILFAIGCSTNQAEDGNMDLGKFEKIASHLENTGQGDIVTNVYIQKMNGVTIVRIETIKDGNKKTRQQVFDTDNFVIREQIGAHIVAQTPAEITESGGGTDVMVFSQKLEKARDAMLKNDYVSALEALNSALQIDSFNPQAHMMKGSIFYSMGKYDLAKKEFDFVLKVDPGNVEVKRFKEFMESESSNETGKLKISGTE
ncbi:MAG: hypothetical protein HOD92_11045 [Deltaproteobacteria bacterium]|jgi:tetratricopeptide (TPR) repeat protein|nr:hypothetical protein [Deltaproteobacteria bacterium]